MNYENYDPFFPDQPVVDLYLPIWASLPRFKHKPAFIWAKDSSTNTKNDQHKKTFSTLTYSQLNNSVLTISINLLFHLSRRDKVIILSSPGLDLVEVIFGCQRAGLIIIPIFPPHPSFQNNYHHLIRVVSQTKPKAAIAHKNYITGVQKYLSSSPSNNKFTQVLTTLKWIPTEEIKANGPTPRPKDSSIYKGCGPEEVYLIQYTSAATGIPKPVLVTSGAAIHNVREARKSYDLHPNSVIVSWLPQYHNCGLQFLLLNIISGATSVLTSPVDFINRPRIWLELISEFNGSCTPVTSFTLPLVVRRGRDGEKGEGSGRSSISLWSLKNLILINEPIYKVSVEEFVDLFRPFGLNPSCISPSYGLAENCTFVSTSWRSGNSGKFVSFPSYKKLLPCARLDYSKNLGEKEKEEMEIVIVNEGTCEIVDDGIEGEIWVSSPSNCFGYLGHPTLTREIFQARIKSKSSKCFLRTGDRGVIKGKERYLYVIGRCSDVIKLPNNKGEVHPHYIETIAQNSSSKFIRGCIVAFDIGNVIAIVAELQRDDMEVKVLKGICEGIRKDVVEEEGVKVGLVVLVKSGSIPKTTSGKVKRQAAKDKLVRNEMKVVIEVKFDVENVGFNSSSFGVASKGRGGGEGRRINMVGKDEEDNQELWVSISGSTRIGPSLRPLL